MKKLCDMKCKACEGGTKPLQSDEISSLVSQLDTAWEIMENHKLRREFRFKNFAQGLDFVNKVGQIAETEHHHPDIYLSWGRVTVDFFTHAIGGLSDNDFIMASKIDKI